MSRDSRYVSYATYAWRGMARVTLQYVLVLVCSSVETARLDFMPKSLQLYHHHDFTHSIHSSDSSTVVLTLHKITLLVSVHFAGAVSLMHICTNLLDLAGQFSSSSKQHRSVVKSGDDRGQSSQAIKLFQVPRKML